MACCTSILFSITSLHVWPFHIVWLSQHERTLYAIFDTTLEERSDKEYTNGQKVITTVHHFLHPCKSPTICRQADFSRPGCCGVVLYRQWDRDLRYDYTQEGQSKAFALFIPLDGSIE